MPDPASPGRVALAEGRWRDAADAFEAAVAREATAENLHGLGAALWWLGEQRRHVALLTAAYAAYRRIRDDIGAVQVALDLCCTFKSNYGDVAVASGWLGRAARLTGDGPLAGWVDAIRAYLRPAASGAVGLARAAVDAGRRAADTDLELCALATLGHAQVLSGAVGPGLERVDEAMAGVVARECARHETVAFTSCEMLDACAAAGDTRRAAEWCRVAEGFTDRHGSPYLYVRCRVLYGDVLARAGALARAEEELRCAVAAVDGAGPLWRAHVLGALATIRLARGDLEEADRLAAASAGHPAVAVPAAAVHLARGETDAATAVLQGVLPLGDGPEPLLDPRDRDRVLALLVQVRLRTDDPGGSAAAAEALGDPAQAALAAGRIALAAGDGDGAALRLQRAVALFVARDEPLEAARARLELARALSAERPEAAAAEASAALACAEAADARPIADAAAAMLRALGRPGPPGRRGGGVLSGRERQVLHLVGLGLSNPEIAARLHISRKTAAHHISHVLTKLGVPNRAAAAAIAARDPGSAGEITGSG